MENPCDEVLEIVEVQCGQYLEEDDIERLEDDFGKKELKDIGVKR